MKLMAQWSMTQTVHLPLDSGTKLKGRKLEDTAPKEEERQMRVCPCD